MAAHTGAPSHDATPSTTEASAIAVTAVAAASNVGHAHAHHVTGARAALVDAQTSDASGIEPTTGAAAHEPANVGPVPPAHDHQCCTCLGQCCAAAPVATPVPMSAAFADPPLRELTPTRSVYAAYVPLARAHVLPFANGPPHTA
jgi:hypothetical protein